MARPRALVEMQKVSVKAVAERRRRLVLARLKLQAEIREINAILQDIERMSKFDIKGRVKK